MLSILIPVYNFPVGTLVRALHAQALALGVPFEILCFDDASTDADLQEANRPLQQLPGVQYREMSRNQGRARIRNLLAAAAAHPYLLFMDCDSGVVSPQYLAQYVSRLPGDCVLYGGRSYQALPPQSPELYFHWHYGRQREQQPAAQRQQSPYHAFMTNNFLVPADIFKTIGFEERLVQYGHEDTLFGLALAHRGVPIAHLDNPLEHLGIEPAAVFLHKSEQALDNLHWLLQEGLPIETRLTRWAAALKRKCLARPLRLLAPLLLPLLRRHLLSARPHLTLFDAYKLLYLLQRC